MYENLREIFEVPTQLCTSIQKIAFQFGIITKILKKFVKNIYIFTNTKCYTQNSIPSFHNNLNKILN